MLNCQQNHYEIISLFKFRISLLLLNSISTEKKNNIKWGKCFCCLQFVRNENNKIEERGKEKKLNRTEQKHEWLPRMNVPFDR